MFEGNVKFRALVATRKEEYNATDSYKAKSKIGKEVFDVISGRGGRFLKQVHVVTRRRRKGRRRAKNAAEPSVAWRQVPTTTGLDK